MITQDAPVSVIGMRRLLSRILIVLAVSMSFRTFQFFPGMFYAQETWYMTCLLILLLAYPFWKMHAGLQFTRFEIYLLLLMIADPVMSAWRAQQVFGQPLEFGILSQRDIVLIAAWLILANLLRRGMIEMANLESALLYLAWGTFALYSCARLFLKPSDFGNYGEGLVTHAMIGTEPHFKFQPYFLVFGTLYYAILGIRSERRRFYLASAILFFSALGGSGRGLAVSAAATLIVVLYRVRGPRAASIALARFASLAVILGVVIYFVSSQRFSARIAGFSDAFTVATTGSTTGDVSANARLFETIAALPYIQAHPFLGNGVVSHQWQGGSEMALGQYFFASDIGIFGIVFSFGFIGLFLYAIQYWIAWLAVKKLPPSFHSPLIDATKAFILFSAIYSFETGLCVWDVGATLFFITLLDSTTAHAFTLNSTDNRTPDQCLTQRPALSA